MVADFGCGDCKIARSVKNKVHSFDLAAACELVTVCDMANVSVSCSLCANSCTCLCDCQEIKHTHSLRAGPASRRLRGHRRVLPFSYGNQLGRFSSGGQSCLKDGVRLVVLIQTWQFYVYILYLCITVLYNYCRGVLKIAEVASRFENVRSFITALAGLGFKMVSKVRRQTR